MYYVYALHNQSSGGIYIGQTNNLTRRVKQHNSKNNCHYTTKQKGEWQVIHVEVVKTRSEALKREKQLKSARGRQFIKTRIPA